MLSLEQLRTDYIDLALIHWPGTIDAPNPAPPCLRPPNNWKVCRAESWRALETLFRNGTVRAIGVSNFEENHLQEIINMRGLLPAVNQFEFHPYWHTGALSSTDLPGWCVCVCVCVCVGGVVWVGIVEVR